MYDSFFDLCAGPPQLDTALDPGAFPIEPPIALATEFLVDGVCAFADQTAHGPTLESWDSERLYSSFKEEEFLYSTNGQEPPDTTELGDVVVTGGYARLLGWRADTSGFGDQNNPSGDSSVQAFDPNWNSCLPAPEGDAPDDRTLVRTRLIAEQIASRIEAFSGQQDDWEWGALIYEMSDGSMGHTDLFSLRADNEIGFPYSSPGWLPDGAHVVAWVHSHPNVHGAPDQGRLSAVDDRAPDQMRSNAAGRYTTSANVMTYLLDAETGRIYEFDEADAAGSSGLRIFTCSR